jgi:hypothetical protein
VAEEEEEEEEVCVFSDVFKLQNILRRNPQYSPFLSNN